MIKYSSYHYSVYVCFGSKMPQYAKSIHMHLSSAISSLIETVEKDTACKVRIYYTGSLIPVLEHEL